MSFFTTEALPVLGGLFFNRLGGAVENEVLVEANLEVRIQRIVSETIQCSYNCK